MGQRHQVYVLARLRPFGGGPPRHRCIARIHDQCCYGEMPVQATRRFFSLIKRRENMEIIKTELRDLDGKYGGDEAFPPSPCPFIEFLTIAAWSVDLSDPSSPFCGYFPPLVLGCNGQPSQGDNNDGITVLDVTDPDTPGYCFASICGLERTESGDTVRWANLSAKQYLRAYHPIPSEKEMEDRFIRTREELVRRSIEEFEGERLIDIATLMSAWPSEYSNRMKKRPTAVPKQSTRPNEIPEAVKGVEQLKELLENPCKVGDVVGILRQQGNLTDYHLEALKKVLEAEMNDCSTDATIDLSELSISYMQLRELLPTFSVRVQSLNLSHNPVITIQAVRHIISTLPELKRLVLMDCPLISGPDISSLLNDEPALFYNLEALIHPLFLRPYNNSTDDPQWPIQFTFIGTGPLPNTMAPMPLCALPFFSPIAVIQSFTDILRPNCYPPSWAANHLPSAANVPPSLFAAALRKPGQAWAERTITHVPQFSIRGLTGQGWVLVLESELARLKLSTADDDSNPDTGTLDHSGIYSQMHYGFVKFGQGQADGEVKDNARWPGLPVEILPNPQYDHIYDWKSFLLQMAAEGRPEVPGHLVKELEDVVNTLDPSLHPKRKHTATLELFTREHLDEFLNGKKQNWETMQLGALLEQQRSW
ncbi:hypothetical protein HYDPIDRAFT_29729 [Hydnomerulius pinastri MD-312]|uniref:Unplaced genomic scaffold scaffold_18, whole genome shotgun sequence n=1 Tax=Hydnomerulius pinastri MD-312 TaxID=994086 RepID=A0A0C9W793_9AGAM|nr:hypothetical protein HYDPIDRAFT_29729 [Hydnomerulius pinastri MD-312]